MKRALSILILLSILPLMAACAHPHYQTDKTAAQLAEAAVAVLSEETVYLTDPGGYTDAYFAPPDYLIDVCIRYAQDTGNIDEIGIFRVTKGKGEEMAELLRGYLTESYMENLAWYNSYIPKETPKLRDAEVTVFGDTVVYAILSESDRAAVFRTMEDALTD